MVTNLERIDAEDLSRVIALHVLHVPRAARIVVNSPLPRRVVAGPVGPAALFFYGPSLRRGHECEAFRGESDACPSSVFEWLEVPADPEVLTYP